MLGAIENGCLQILRVATLAFAAAALIGSVQFGIGSILDLRASPRPVSETISIAPMSLKPSDTPGKPATENAPKAEATVDDASAQAKAFADVLTKHFKALVDPKGDITPDMVHAALQSYRVDGMDSKAITAMIAYVDATFSDPANAAESKGDKFLDRVDEILRSYHARYMAEKHRIDEEKTNAAADAATSKQTGLWYGYLAAGLFFTFMSLALLLVLLRVDRSIKSISTAAMAR